MTTDIVIAKGEHICACAHGDEPDEDWHWYRVIPRDKVVRSDGVEFECEWIRLCNECFAEVGSGKAMAQVRRDFILNEAVVIDRPTN